MSDQITYNPGAVSDFASDVGSRAGQLHMIYEDTASKTNALQEFFAGRPGEKNMPFWGTSFSAAYVSGVAALVRAKFPELTAYQVINRIVQSAHNPPAGVDNKLGYGLVDPVAALTFNIPSGDRMAPGAQSRVITPAAPPPPPDHRARNIAIGFVGAVATGVLAMAIGARLRRAR